MRRQNVRISIAAVAALSLVAAACGDDDDEDASPTTAGQAATTAGAPTPGGSASSTVKPPSGEPIEVMSVEILTGGAGGSVYPANVAAAKAAAAAVNAEGGIKGRPLVVTVCDTKLNSAQEVACSQELEQSDAVAVISDATSLSTTMVDTTVKARIASIGPKGYATSNYLATSVSQFPIYNGAQALFACPPALQAAGATKIGVIGADAAIGDIIAGGAKAVIANTPGTSFTSQVKVPLNATDFAGPLLTAINNGADGAVVALGPPQLVAMMKANNDRVKICSAIGNPSDADLITLGDAADGFIGISSVPPMNLLRDTESGKQFFADLAAYEKSSGDKAAAGDQQDIGSLNAWMAVRAFQKVANSVPGEVTRESIFEGFTNLKDLDFPGILPSPIDYTKMKPIPNLARLYLSEYSGFQWNAKEKAWQPLTKQPSDLIKLLTGG